MVGKFESWSPAQYITGLPKKSLAEMKLDTEGVLSLEICCDNTIIDFNLKHAMKNTEHPYPKDVDPPMWDFVLTRGDGVQFLLHPSWKWKKDKGKGTLLDDKKIAERMEANRTNMKLQQWQRKMYSNIEHGKDQEGIAERSPAAAGSSSAASPAVAGQGASSAQQAPSPMPQRPPPSGGAQAARQAATPAATPAATFKMAPLHLQPGGTARGPPAQKPPSAVLAPAPPLPTVVAWAAPRPPPPPPTAAPAQKAPPKSPPTAEEAAPTAGGSGGVEQAAAPPAAGVDPAISQGQAGHVSTCCASIEREPPPSARAPGPAAGQNIQQGDGCDYYMNRSAGYWAYRNQEHMFWQWWTQR